MLAGSTCRSTFSPASTLPLAKSISTHALPTIFGGGGTGRSLLSARGAAAGVGPEAGDWASASPNTAVSAADVAQAASVERAFISAISGAGGAGASGGQSIGSFADAARQAEAQAAD